MSVPPAANAQNIDRLLSAYKHLDPDLITQLTANSACKETMQPFWTVLQALQAEHQFQTRLRGNTSFTFNSDEASGNTRHRLAAGMTVNRGAYPSQIEFSTNLGVTLRGSTFEEEVSQLSISYDYHHSLNFENFFFAERHTDNFLGIDQRYEVGGGLIVQHWGGYTAAGQAPLEKLNAYDLAAAYDLAVRLDTMAAKDRDTAIDVVPTAIDSTTRTWYQCLALASSGSANNTLEDEELLDEILSTRADLEALLQLQQDALRAEHKRYVRLRIGVLLGFFAELEKATAADTLVIDSAGTKQFFSTSLPGRQVYRWQVRPTFTYRFSDRWRLDVRPYLKFPMPWEWEDEVIGTDPNRTDRRFDFRLNWRNSLTVTIADRFLHSGIVSAQLIYQILYDHAPPRVSRFTLGLTQQ